MKNQMFNIYSCPVYKLKSKQLYCSIISCGYSLTDNKFFAANALSKKKQDTIQKSQFHKEVCIQNDEQMYPMTHDFCFLTKWIMGWCFKTLTILPLTNQCVLSATFYNVSWLNSNIIGNIEVLVLIYFMGIRRQSARLCSYNSYTLICVSPINWQINVIIITLYLYLHITNVNSIITKYIF